MSSRLTNMLKANGRLHQQQDVPPQTNEQQRQSFQQEQQQNLRQPYQQEQQQNLRQPLQQQYQQPIAQQQQQQQQQQQVVQEDIDNINYFQQKQQLHSLNYNPKYNPDLGRQSSSGSSSKQQQQQQQQVTRQKSSQQSSIPYPLLPMEDSLNYKKFSSAFDQIVPPNSFENFIQQDKGSAGPRYIRPTIYSFATDPSILESVKIPLGCIIQPFANPPFEEEEAAPFIQNSIIQVQNTPTDPPPATNNNQNNPPVIAFEEALFRCVRCHAYVNPFFQRKDNILICNICGKFNIIPPEYDSSSRPEFTHGVYDLLAPKAYRPKPAQSNLILLCIELTQQTISSGVAISALQSIQTSLGSISSEQKTQIAICTYNSTINFYSIPKDLSNEPQLIVVTEIEEPFCPFSIQSLFIDSSEHKDKLDYLIESMIKQITNSQVNQYPSHNNSIAGLAVIQSAISSFEDQPGKIILFSSSHLPSKGYGKLIKKEDPKQLLNTDQEKVLYQASNKLYTDMSAQLLKSGIAVDMFLFGNEFIDLPTVSVLSQQTGGSVFLYNGFNPCDQEKFHYQVFRILTRQYAIDCVMTLRTSPGIQLEDFYTSQGKLAVRDLKLSEMNSDSVLAVVYKQEEKLNANENSRSYLQFAVLYTNSYDGTTRIRVINLAVPISSSSQALFKYADLDATFSLLIRKALSNITTQSIKQIQEQLTQQIVSILLQYRIACATGSSSQQLILPDTLKYMIIYTLSLYKTSLFASNQLPTPTSDGKYYDLLRLLNYPPQQLANFLCPKIYPIHNILNGNNDIGEFYADDKVAMPSSVNNQYNSLDQNGIYLIDNSETIFIYILKQADITLIQYLFGSNVQEQDIQDLTQYPYALENEEDSSLRMKVNNIIDQLRRNKNSSYQNISVVPSISMSEPKVRGLLVADEMRGQMSYSNFICDIHNKIQSKVPK